MLDLLKDACFCTDAAASADVTIEGLRPGVMERLGLGPEELCWKSDLMVYGRIRTWCSS